ncbi:hypothetical protein PR048_009470 [Dryococelus australis]|uniref:Uncharacterized protein n=1 Tax=Dryococelus australis TaxID=614101 RepID=A0ABQ9I015_9NEOP|nr:hypothetical protein PR048_009470 [Dryococelus australis]
MLTCCNTVYKAGRRLTPHHPFPLVFHSTCDYPAFNPAVVRVDSQHVQDQDEHVEEMNDPEVPSVLSSSQGNDNEFGSTDPISSSASSMVPELNSATLTISCLDFGHLISNRSVVALLTRKNTSGLKIDGCPHQTLNSR